MRNAGSAGASGVIVFNEGQPGRTDPFPLDLGEWRAGIPMVFASFALGNELAGTPGATVRLKVDATLTLGTDHNVIAETPWGDARNVVMVGAHLDSVPAGPGINDNGSGSAAVLETALQIAHFPVRNKVRVAFWAAEEIGLLGSDQYVEGLTAAERDRIRLYLNFDMIASPNFATKLYDGDNSNAIGVMAGGIFTGAEGIKTAAEQALFGGTAGVAYDICYHQACDTIANVNATALDVNSDAIADSTARYAFNLTSIP